MSDPLQHGRNRLTAALQRDYGRLVGFVGSRLPASIQDHDPEDVLSDVVLRLLERADLLAEVENVTAYLFTALGHRIVDLFRRKREQPLPDHDDATTAAAPEDVQQRLEISQALSVLSTAERAVWLAVELDGISFRELAQLWDVPIGTLLSRKSRATKALRRLLSDDGDRLDGNATKRHRPIRPLGNPP